MIALAAAARPAMQEQGGAALRVAAGLPIDLVPFANVQMSAGEGLKRRIERAGARPRALFGAPLGALLVLVAAVLGLLQRLLGLGTPWKGRRV